MCNNRSYSDAEIFPHAFRSLGLGKIVGQATGGFVIGTTSTRLIDGSIFRLPRTGVFTANGVNMEKHGVIPDVAVEITASDWTKGIDTQLARAVQVVSADVAVWKQKRSTVASRPTIPPAPATNPTPASGATPAKTSPVPSLVPMPAPKTTSPSRTESKPATIPLAVD